MKTLLAIKQILDLLQLQHKINFIFIFSIFLLIPIVSSIDIGVSPANLNFVVSPNEVSCKKVILFSDKLVNFHTEDKWSLENTKDINNYSIDSKNLNLILTYPKEIDFKNKKNIQVCFKANYSGKYYGILIFKENNSGIGIWISSTVEGNIYLNNTEEIISTQEKIHLNYHISNNFYLIYSSLITSLLLSLLLLLVSYNKYKII